MTPFRASYNADWVEPPDLFSGGDEEILMLPAKEKVGMEPFGSEPAEAVLKNLPRSVHGPTMDELACFINGRRRGAPSSNQCQQ